MIPLADPGASYRAHKIELDTAVQRVLASGWYILGQEVEAFEREFAGYCGTHHGVGVGNGTDAIRIALQASGVGPGDEVITVSHTAVATVSAILETGATPVLVDVEPEGLTLDPEKCRAAITPRTKAIVPVHIYGQPAEMDTIMALARENGIFVLEDCAQAHGAKYKGRTVGSIGDAAAFSFYPTKNLGAFGDGGMVVTHSPELAERLRLFRQYGWAERYVSSLHAGNSRLDEMQAALLRVRLGHLDDETVQRRDLAQRYRELLTDAPIQLPPLNDVTEPVYHLFVVRTPHRNALAKGLADAGIGTGVHYPTPVHQQPGYAERVLTPAPLPATERASGTVLSLPMHPGLTRSQVTQVAERILELTTVIQDRST